MTKQPKEIAQDIAALLLTEESGGPFVLKDAIQILLDAGYTQEKIDEGKMLLEELLKNGTEQESAEL